MCFRNLLAFSFLLLASPETFGQGFERKDGKELLLENLKRLQEVESFTYRARSAFKWLSYPERERDSLFGEVVVHREPEDTVFGAHFHGTMVRVRKANSEADTSQLKVHYDGEHLLKYRPSSEHLVIYRAEDARDRLPHFSRILKPDLLDPSSILEHREGIRVKNVGNNAERACERFQFLVPASNDSLPPFYREWCFGKKGSFPVRIKDSSRYQGRYQEHALQIEELSLNEQVLEKVQKLRIDSGDPESYRSAVDLMASEGTPKDSVEIEFYDPSEHRESPEERKERLSSVDPAPALKGLPFPIKNGKDSTLLKAPFEAELLLLDFWYMDCSPCRKAIPHLNELHKEYKEQGLRVVGVDPMDEADRMTERWGNFSAHNPIAYDILLTGRGIADRYHVRGYPTFFLFGPDGQLLMAEQGFKKEHMEELEKKVEEHLKKDR
ncbi:MAG: TlpA family protein disulfide reductase [Flavobacteriales bacterium]